MSGAVLKPDPIVKALHGAFCRDASRQELLQLAASRMGQAGSPYGAVYMYAFFEGAFHLEALDGPPTDLTRIPANSRGDADAGIAIRRHDDVLGMIRIESDTAGPLAGPELDAVREVADALAVLL